MELVAIVNSYNRLSLMRLGLPSLIQALQSCPFRSAVVIFDAGSNDGSKEWLKEFFQQNPDISIDLIFPASGQDTSFSAGVNRACEYAAKKYPDLKWYFLFETDNWIANAEPILKARSLLKTQLRLAAAGFTVTKHSRERAGFGCSFPTVWQFIMGQQLTHWLKLDRPRIERWEGFNDMSWTSCDVIYTSPLLVRRSAWEESRGLDTVMFPFSDCDIDWAWRVNKLGWKLGVLKTEGVVHDNQQALSAWSDNRVIHFHRARLQLLLKHKGVWVKLIKPVLFIRHCLEFFLLLVMYLCLKDPKKSLKKRQLLIKSVFKNYEDI